MKTIKINFINFWSGWDKEKNFITDSLRKKFNVIISEQPDFLFASSNGNESVLKNKCVRIMFLGENLVPDFNLYDYGIGFSHIDFEDRYLRWPLYLLYYEDVKKAMKKHLITKEAWEEKKEFCCMVVSNAQGKQRNHFFELLSNKKKVNSGGKYKNNVGGPVVDKIEFLRKHRFSIAFENSSTSGYLTEKLLQAFSAGTIPIYWGDPRAVEEFNPAAFINCHDFRSWDQVIDHILYLEKHPEEEWKMISAPIWKEDSLVYKYVDSNGEWRMDANGDTIVDRFLYQICKQKRKDAYRRNRVFWGAGYEKKQEKAEQAINQINKFKIRCAKGITSIKELIKIVKKR